MGASCSPPAWQVLCLLVSVGARPFDSSVASLTRTSVHFLPPARSSPGLEALRKSPTLDQANQTAPSVPTATAPAPGLGRRSPAHGRAAPSTSSQSIQKPHHLEEVDSRRGESLRGGQGMEGASAPRLAHSVFSHPGEPPSALCCSEPFWACRQEDAVEADEGTLMDSGPLPASWPLSRGSSGSQECCFFSAATVLKPLLFQAPKPPKQTVSWQEVKAGTPGKAPQVNASYHPDSACPPCP